MIKIIEYNNWMIVEQEGEVVFEGEQMDGMELEDILKRLGVKVDYQYSSGVAPRD